MTSLYEMEKKVKNWGAKFSDFPIGTKVKIVCLMQDMMPWNGETGVVIKNTGKYLGIEVKLDQEIRFGNPKEYGVLKTFGFAPEDLKVIPDSPMTNEGKQGMKFKCADYKKLLCRKTRCILEFSKVEVLMQIPFPEKCPFTGDNIQWVEVKKK